VLSSYLFSLFPFLGSKVPNKTPKSLDLEFKKENKKTTFCIKNKEAGCCCYGFYVPVLLLDGERAGYVCVLPIVMVVYEFGWVLVTGVGNLFVYIFLQVLCHKNFLLLP